MSNSNFPAEGKVPGTDLRRTIVLVTPFEDEAREAAETVRAAGYHARVWRRGVNADGCHAFLSVVSARERPGGPPLRELAERVPGGR